MTTGARLDGGDQDVRVTYDVRIPMPDGITLGADLYLPPGDAPAPTLLTAYPYRKDVMGVSMAPALREFAVHGYACVLIDLRGTGSSDGTRHPVVGTGEGEDLAAAIAWAARQEWSTGRVGMWGISYGCVTTLRTAACKPPELQAILPLMGPVDPGHEAFYFHGARMDTLQRGHWGAGLLAGQLLPPLLGFDDPDAQQRWQRRLEQDAPLVLDLTVPVEDVSWRERALDVERIDVPAFVVGGWRDLYVDSALELHERLSTPKKLLIGPWGHTMPQDSPVRPVDFLRLALRWWDHWLRDVDDGFLDEAPVLLQPVGGRDGWRAFGSWPRTEDRVLTAAGARLVAGDTQPGSGVIGRYEPDPRIGTLSGLQGLGRGDVEVPVDQHADDARCVTATTDPLVEDLVLCGRASVELTIVGAPQRLVVRLAEVDGFGRSRHVTTGVLTPNAQQERYGIDLTATHHRIAAGQRLRLTVSDADFPRLMPLPHPEPFDVTALRLVLPTLGDAQGQRTELPALAQPSAEAVTPGLGAGFKASALWSVTDDLIDEATEVAIGMTTPPISTTDGHLLATDEQTQARTSRSAPAEATVVTTHHKDLRLADGQLVEVDVKVTCTQGELHARGQVRMNGSTLTTRTWQASLEGSGSRPAPAPHQGALSQGRTGETV